MPSRLVSVLTGVVLSTVLWSSAHGQFFSSGRCLNQGVPEYESFTPLPQGELFCSLLADPKQPRSFASMLQSRIYHQSSHLGDEFLLGSHVTRENLSFESIEVLLSQEVEFFRMYGGGEYFFNRNPEELEPRIGHGGLELRPGTPLIRIDPLGSVRFIAAGDLKFAEQQDWEPGWSIRAGLEGSRPRPPEIPVSRW